MTYLQATVFGAIQGLTEFLPVSSSAHLTLAPWIIGWPDPGLSFDVALHLGTLAAVLAYFWRDWLALAAGAARRPSGREGRLLLLLALATLPGAAAGLALEKQAETLFREPARIAFAMIFFGLLMGWADRAGRRERDIDRLSAPDALAIGLAQALAIIPGVSRSGATLTAGLALGLTRPEAARWSFLLATPIILGAGVHKMRHVAAADITGPFLWGIAVSALTGLAAVHVFMNRLRRSDLRPFVIYRVAAGLAVLALVSAGFRG